jgi:hypothetical protein
MEFSEYLRHCKGFNDLEKCKVLKISTFRQIS